MKKRIFTIVLVCIMLIGMSAAALATSSELDSVYNTQYCYYHECCRVTDVTYFTGMHRIPLAEHVFGINESLDLIFNDGARYINIFYGSVDELFEKLNDGYGLPDSGRNIRRFIIDAYTGEVLDYPYAALSLMYGVKCCEYYNNCDHIGIVPYWPWTSCTNILGHAWGAWSLWHHNGNIIHSWTCPDRGFGITNTLGCTMPISRRRFCTRSGCNAFEQEDDIVIVFTC
jgi:hypothetical protein